MGNETPMAKAMREAGVKQQPVNIARNERKTYLQGRSSIQNQFLDNLIGNQSQAKINLIGGNNLQGSLTAYDEYCILYKPTNSNNQELVFKHSISSVSLTE